MTANCHLGYWFFFFFFSFLKLTCPLIRFTFIPTQPTLMTVTTTTMHHHQYQHYPLQPILKPLNASKWQQQQQGLKACHVSSCSLVCSFLLLFSTTSHRTTPNSDADVSNHDGNSSSSSIDSPEYIVFLFPSYLLLTTTIGLPLFEIRWQYVVFL